MHTILRIVFDARNMKNGKQKANNQILKTMYNQPMAFSTSDEEASILCVCLCVFL